MVVVDLLTMLNGIVLVTPERDAKSFGFRTHKENSGDSLCTSNGETKRCSVLEKAPPLFPSLPDTANLIDDVSAPRLRMKTYCNPNSSPRSKSKKRDSSINSKQPLFPREATRQHNSQEAQMMRRPLMDETNRERSKIARPVFFTPKAAPLRPRKKQPDISKAFCMQPRRDEISFHLPSSLRLPDLG